MGDTIILSELDVELELLEFTFKDKSEYLVLYMLMIFGDEDIPFIVDGNLIFFDEISLAPAVLDLMPPNIRAFSPPPEEPDAFYDFPLMVKRIENVDVDPDCTILNILNRLFDFQEAFSIPLPPTRKKILYPFADHLTFNREFKSFLDESGISRGEAKEAVEWLMKQVFPHCMVLTSDGKIPLEEWMRKEQVTLY
ncbi:MAG: hypothetical protein GY765_23420 [bacterium]|nr:hypothetical protein [bacterium]